MRHVRGRRVFSPAFFFCLLCHLLQEALGVLATAAIRCRTLQKIRETLCILSNNSSGIFFFACHCHWNPVQHAVFVANCCHWTHACALSQTNIYTKRPSIKRLLVSRVNDRFVNLTCGDISSMPYATYALIRAAVLFLLKPWTVLPPSKKSMYTSDLGQFYASQPSRPGRIAIGFG